MADPLTSNRVRYCICADPENCTQTVPGYVCKRRYPPKPLTAKQRIRALQEEIGILQDSRRIGWGAFDD